jgi:septal ring factor EnvC (AmiA/AmiB activator)
MIFDRSLIMPNKTFLFPFLLLLLCITSALSSLARVKETHKLIEEWVQTELLISEESSFWKSEKASLLDLENALSHEITELDKGLAAFESEESSIQDERSKLAERKNEAEVSTKTLREGLQRLDLQIEKIFKVLPAPLKKKLSPFKVKDNKLPLRKRLELTVSLLQAIHIFNRTVTLERLEFTLDDNKSREFIVLYFGLGVAYFVNESATVAGYGQPTGDGWKWVRMDELGSEISTGVDMMKNRTLPRFLELPLPMPKRIDQ